MGVGERRGEGGGKENALDKKKPLKVKQLINCTSRNAMNSSIFMPILIYTYKKQNINTQTNTNTHTTTTDTLTHIANTDTDTDTDTEIIHTNKAQSMFVELLNKNFLQRGPSLVFR